MKIQNLLKKGLIGGLIAASLNTIIYFVAIRIGALPENLPLPDGSTLDSMRIIASSFMPGIFAALILFGISKKSNNPSKVFTTISYIFLLLSMTGPILMPNLTIGTRITFSIMHLAAGIPIIYLLTQKEEN